MTIIQFIAEMIKVLSEFQADWKVTRSQLGFNELGINDKRTFADWLFIFKEYALKTEDDQPF